MASADSKSTLPPDAAIEDASDAQSILPPYEETSRPSPGPASGPSPGAAPPAYQPSMLEVGWTAGKGKDAAVDTAMFDVYAYNAEIVAAAALLLDGQTIVAEHAPSTPLYRVNRGLATLGPATKAVELDRLEQRCDEAPMVLRPRNMYTLHRSRAFDYVVGLGGALGGSRPEFYMRATNARAAPLGHLGLRGRSFASWSAEPVLMEFNSKDGVKGLGWDQAHPAPVFRAQHRPTRQGVLSWLDATGHEVALMYETMEARSIAVQASVDRGKDAAVVAPPPPPQPTDTPRLLVTAPMRRDQRDALVAVWCCYAWAQGVSRHVDVPLPRGKNPYHYSRVFN
ncbi:hypothetical protein SPBR_04343 [Sporothrix brasiliensis 5110]|uniref:Uncharacterized protein n=1 Tax=Sporothrix brasiliensis 5110 TaxID=1398154 RepID=A0A0C2J431_9PEZI|nr:uncharacterized protein SPBR_04343 [Sporothrix brasiliensis 5110]KIH93760.1 hypothetical protein SPBR_04343 [Sporothrix brasiliensis 5110]